jgi:transcriptional regulator with XRE-family HTH domain
MDVDKILIKIKNKRQQLNYSQEYMALVLQMNQANYNKIENGKVELTVPVLLKIDKILDLDVLKFLAEFKTNTNES